MEINWLIQKYKLENSHICLIELIVIDSNLW
jgi:hypothetical protein